MYHAITITLKALDYKTAEIRPWMPLIVLSVALLYAPGLAHLLGIEAFAWLNHETAVWFCGCLLADLLIAICFCTILLLPDNRRRR
jgi:hypothetical protein